MSYDRIIEFCDKNNLDLYRYVTNKGIVYRCAGFVLKEYFDFEYYEETPNINYKELINEFNGWHDYVKNGGNK